MDRAEYTRRISAEKDWAPGWDAIVDEYKAAEGAAPLLCIPQDTRRQALEGFGVYLFPSGYAHLVTRGLSQIWPNEAAFTGTRSGWGFELTVQWPTSTMAGCGRAYKLLEHVAQYINVRKLSLQPGRYLPLSRFLSASEFSSDSCAGVLFVPDTRLRTIQTIHGEVSFLQLVNVTRYELTQLEKHPGLSTQLEYGLRQAQPLLPFDINRRKNYLL